MGGRAGRVEALQAQAAGLLTVVVAGDAILPDQLLVFARW